MWTERKRLVVLALVAATVLRAPTVLATPSAEADARTHFELGRRYHELGEYPSAVSEFKQAYVASAIPLFLFNIAQSYRRAGDARQALLFYERFLQLAPNAVERPEVEQNIRELRKSLPPDDMPTRQPPVVVIEQPVPPVEQPVRATRKRVGLIVGVTVGSAVVIGTAIALGIVFGARHDSTPTDLGTFSVFR